MRRLVTLLGAAVAVGSVLAATPAQARETFTVTSLHFRVTVGGGQTCEVPADLYLPRTASPSRRVPAILTTNGFGGSKDDQAGLGRYFAGKGYAVLSYSGLGFGGATCKITLDDPATDGAAASQLVSYLGGATGRAFLDEEHTRRAPRLDVVTLDGRGDPRVGMVGGSYGGAVQLAAASVDRRIDALAPFITWNDLSHSLAPNHTSQTSGVSTATPGAAKVVWALGFSARGVLGGLTDAAADPGRLLPCPNFADFVCPALAAAGVTGTLDPTATAELRRRSPVSYLAKVKAPTLLVQGQQDTLFTLDEAAATYRTLRRQGTPVSMIWQQGGHSGAAAPGEFDTGAPNGQTQYVTGRVEAWFERYLKGRTSVSTGPAFSWFRDWVSYSGNARPAYGTSSIFPVRSSRTLHLSGTTLASDRSAVTAGSQTLLTAPLGLPSTVTTIDVVGRSLPVPEVDAPGTAATWTTPALRRAVDVVGSPVARLQVETAVPAGAPDAAKLTVFLRVQDVDPAGKATTVGSLVAPVRVSDPTKPFTVTLPGIVHRFAPGHSVRLVVAGGSVNHRGGLLPVPVTIRTGGAGQTLTLPVTSP